MFGRRLAFWDGFVVPFFCVESDRCGEELAMLKQWQCVVRIFDAFVDASEADGEFPLLISISTSTLHYPPTPTQYIIAEPQYLRPRAASASHSVVTFDHPDSRITGSFQSVSSEPDPAEAFWHHTSRVYQWTSWVIRIQLGQEGTRTRIIAKQPEKLRVFCGSHVYHE